MKHGLSLSLLVLLLLGCDGSAPPADAGPSGRDAGLRDGGGDGGSADAGVGRDGGPPPPLPSVVPDFNPGADAIPGSVWHVATDGDDASGDGSEGSPWATVTHALTRVSPGDGIAVHAGTYHERVAITVSGEEGRYLSIFNWEGGEVTFDGDGVDLSDGTVGRWVRGVIHVHEAGYVRIAGLRVIRSADNGIAASLSHHVVIEGCRTYDTVSSGIGIWATSEVTVRRNRVELACNDGSQECITIAGTSVGVAVVENEVLNSGPGSRGGEGIDIKGGGCTETAPSGLPQGPSQVFVVGNRVHGINRGCLYNDAWDCDVGPILVSGNEVWDCDGFGMAAAGESGGHLHDVLFTNNVVYRSHERPADFGSTGFAFGYNYGSDTARLSRVAVIHNTFYNMRWSCGRIDSDGVIPGAQSELIVENNLCANAAGPVLATDDNENMTVLLADFDRLGHNLLWFIDPEYSAAGYYSDPLFVGPDSEVADPLFLGDLRGPLSAESFRVASGSPAVGAAIGSAEALETDFGGASRPASGATIGAFEP